MAAVIIVPVLLLFQFELYIKVNRLFGLVATFAIPILDAAYKGFPPSDEQVFNDKEMAELASPEYFAVFSQAGLVDKFNALATARKNEKNVWAPQKALRVKSWKPESQRAKRWRLNHRDIVRRCGL